MTTISYDHDDPSAPLVTLSVLGAPVTAEIRHDGDEIHLLLGPVTLIMLSDQAAQVLTALRDVS